MTTSKGRKKRIDLLAWQTAQPEVFRGRQANSWNFVGSASSSR